MKQTIILLFALALATGVYAQKSATPSKFDAVVSFGSMCCGPASDDFLKAHYKKFTKQNKVTIPAYKAQGCGREGEYKIMFSLSRLKPALKKKYLSELKSLIAKQNKKNKAKDASAGDMELTYNMAAADMDNCRGGISKW